MSIVKTAHIVILFSHIVSPKVAWAAVKDGKVLKTGVVQMKKAEKVTHIHTHTHTRTQRMMFQLCYSGVTVVF
jgi:hypothetical protein